ncbi:MAG TPA: hypothetical protein VFN74_03465, partial [Chloroflexota bacterium]|nr:hypothetical protein [Chloroflexota bacterium]
YELVAMTFALLAYGQLALRRAPGAGLLSLGILMSIVAAGIQASPAVVVLGWTFDHNGLYHLIQMVGVVLVVMGIRVSLTRGGARIPELEADPLPALAAAR